MNRKISIGLAMMAIGTTVTLGSPAYAGQCPKGALNETYDVSVAECNMEKADDKSGDNLMPTLNTIINVVLGVLGLITVVMIIIGGYMYVTSAGDAGKVVKAKNTIMYGVIGLIIALLAFAIVNFVLSSVFKNGGGGGSGGGSSSSYSDSGSGGSSDASGDSSSGSSSGASSGSSSGGSASTSSESIIESGGAGASSSSSGSTSSGAIDE